jgi:hypothetical protein
VGCCYAAGAFSLGSVLGATTSSIYCCYAAGAFSLGSVLGPLLGNDIYIKSSLFFGVCSGAQPASDLLSTGDLSRGV